MKPEYIIYDLIIVGGGAAGFFAAINYAEKHPKNKVIILEQAKEVLSKVRISGGGRCNVTHGCFDPKELTQFYPRGKRELLGPFHHFACGDTMAWFEDRGVSLKIEEDGRVFPKSNSSSSIVDCLLDSAKRAGIYIRYHSKVKNFSLQEDLWKMDLDECHFTGRHLLISTGSSPFIWSILKNLGHRIVSPVPSLFTFHVKDEKIKDLQGLSMPEIVLSLSSHKISTTGPILITHWGLSGPAVLKASAWAALELSSCNYQFDFEIDWIPNVSAEEVLAMKDQKGGKVVSANSEFGFPSRLWKSLVHCSKIVETQKWADLTKEQLTELIGNLKRCKFHANGKSTFKEEFVTAGGIDLKEVDFKTFSSKLYHSLYFAGEVLNIDAVTGGFNFQAAWTGGYIVANSVDK